jgi:hypothetical protein
LKYCTQNFSEQWSMRINHYQKTPKSRLTRLLSTHGVHSLCLELPCKQGSSPLKE